MASLAGKIPLGIEVLVNTKDKFKNKKAILKYVGPLEGMNGEFMGVQLDTADGLHSGENNGKRYFKCKEKHGMFLKNKSVSLPDGTLIADVAGNEAKLKQLKKTVKVKEKEEPKIEIPKTESKTESKTEQVSSPTKEAKNKLSKELSDLKVENFKSEYVHQERDQSQILQENKQLKQQVKELEEKLQTARLESQKIKYAVDSNKQEKLKEINEEVKFYKEQKENFEKDKKKMSERIKALESELEENAENNELLQSLSMKLQTMEGKNESLKQQLEKTKTELRNVKSGANNQMSEGSTSQGGKNLGEEIEVLNETLILLQSDLKEQKEKNEALTKEMEGNKEKVAEYGKMEARLKKRQAQIEELKETVDQYEHAANFAETQTLKMIKKEEELNEASKELSLYVKKVEKLEFDIKENKDLIAEYDSMIILFEEDVDKLNKQIKEKEVQIGELGTTLDRYKQKIIKLAEVNDKRDLVREFEEGPEEPSGTRTQYSGDLYEQKYKDSQKSLQSVTSKYIESQVEYSEIKNQVGIYMLNLMEALPESFSTKFHPDVIQMMVAIKTTNDKLYLLFDTVCQYLREKGQIYSKDNLELALWMIIILDKVGVLYSSLHRIQTAIATSETEAELSTILSRALKDEVRKIDIFTSELLQRFAQENLSSSIDIAAFTQPCETLDKINFNIQKKFNVEYQTKMKLCSQTMKVIYRTFETIIDYKMVSELQQNAQVDINVESFLKMTLTYLKECCQNPHLRYRSTMNKYFSGMEFILNIYNEIQENQKVKQLGNLYSDTEEIKILKDTLVTTQVYTKELLEDLKDIKYPSTLSKVHVRLPGSIWTERTKLIKDQLLRVKQIATEKQELQTNFNEAKRKIAILEKDIKDKQSVKELYEKRIGELQLKVEQSNTLQKENKKQTQKIKALEDSNNVLAEQILTTTSKIKDLQSKMEKNKSTIDDLQTQLVVKDSRKTKNSQAISSEDVANLTIFKNVVKENSHLKTLEYKKKALDLKHSLLLTNCNGKAIEDGETGKKASLLRRKAMETMSKLKIFDPRAQTDSNIGAINNLYIQASRLGLPKDAKQDTVCREVKIGKLTLKGTTQDGALWLGQSQTSIRGF